ncbi:hypothetical protein LOK49_LG06G02079 [Camellia lanceoleosa]|uniref:Uncharacterized protein n=1 Tax=Camellia lanceoleosa TaxID=1840588 RepID=A0ACC0HC82_9ERIC|nr:hypothetical protein LOK49_LG06G02079 [Camellia lanceoleosa]
MKLTISNKQILGLGFKNRIDPSSVLNIYQRFFLCSGQKIKASLQSFVGLNSDSVVDFFYNTTLCLQY